MDKLIDKRLEQLLTQVGDMALKRRAKTIIKELELRNGDRVLEVGCGDGFYLHLLSSIGLKLKLIGTDNDKNALLSARRNLPNDINLVYGDLMNRLPFKDNSFDKVVMSEVTEHLPNDVKGLKEVLRVMKKGGILCLSVPHANYPFLWDPINWVLEKLTNKHIESGFFAGIWNQHLRLYTKLSIERSIKKAGFKVERSEIQTFWCLPFNHLILNIGARMLVKDSKSEFIKGASKFSKSGKKSNPVKIFFFVSQLVDKLNDIIPVKNSGVSIVTTASKELV